MLNRCRCKCSARLFENTAESNSESVEICRTPRGTTNSGSPNTMEDRSTGGWDVAFPALPAVPAVPLDSPQSVNPTRTLTVPGFGGTANLKSPPFTLTIPPRLHRGGCQYDSPVRSVNPYSNGPTNSNRRRYPPHGSSDQSGEHNPPNSSDTGNKSK